MSREGRTFHLITEKLQVWTPDLRLNWFKIYDTNSKKRKKCKKRNKKHYPNIKVLFTKMKQDRRYSDPKARNG